MRIVFLFNGPFPNNYNTEYTENPCLVLGHFVLWVIWPFLSLLPIQHWHCPFLIHYHRLYLFLSSTTTWSSAYFWFWLKLYLCFLSSFNQFQLFIQRLLIPPCFCCSFQIRSILLDGLIRLYLVVLLSFSPVSVESDAEPLDWYPFHYASAFLAAT